jgi:L,D-peptidoglycan transpeptidase YkuD (ErfK/YbiS/YcfS/YnhG family)
MPKIFILTLLTTLLTGQVHAFELPRQSFQLIVGISSDWNDSTVSLQRWQKDGSAWKKVGPAWPGRLGANGLAWGLGLHPSGLPGLQKVEGDRRAPAGVFSLGYVYTYGQNVRCQPGMKVHQVTERDMWVEDEHSDFYNKHLQLPGRGPQTEWEKKQQMRLNDPAHSLKLFIKHNAEAKSVRGAGSSIFFHIWRDNGTRTSFGCTVMAEEALREMIAWVDPKQEPLYVLLPRSEYEQKKKAWGLP